MMKGLIAFSIISLLAGAGNLSTKAQAVFHSQASIHSQGDEHKSIEGELHDKEAWDIDEFKSPEASESPEETFIPTPTPSVSPTATSTLNPSSTPIATISPNPTASGSPTETPTVSPTATATVTTTVDIFTQISQLLNQLISLLKSR